MGVWFREVTCSSQGHVSGQRSDHCLLQVRRPTMPCDTALGAMFCFFVYPSSLDRKPPDVGMYSILLSCWFVPGSLLLTDPLETVKGSLLSAQAIHTYYTSDTACSIGVETFGKEVKASHVRTTQETPVCKSLAGDTKFFCLDS